MTLRHVQECLRKVKLALELIIKSLFSACKISKIERIFDTNQKLILIINELLLVIKNIKNHFLKRIKQKKFSQ